MEFGGRGGSDQAIQRAIKWSRSPLRDRAGDRVKNRAIEWAVDRPIGRALEEVIERSSEWSSDRGIDSAIDRANDRAGDRSIKRANDRVGDQASKRAIEWAIEQVINRSFFVSRRQYWMYRATRKLETKRTVSCYENVFKALCELNLKINLGPHFQVFIFYSCRLG